MLSSEPGITVMDFRMYFGFVYGILFDGRVITRKTRKSHRNTENIKNRLDGTHVVPSPAPTRNPQNSTEFTKRGRGWGEAFEYARSRLAPPFLCGCTGTTLFQVMTDSEKHELNYRIHTLPF